jgi:hypothetical protein
MRGIFQVQQQYCKFSAIQPMEWQYCSQYVSSVSEFLRIEISIFVRWVRLCSGNRGLSYGFIVKRIHCCLDCSQ